MREIPHAGDTNLWSRSTDKLLIYTGCFTHYIVLIIYCLISVCMETVFVDCIFRKVRPA